MSFDDREWEKQFFFITCIPRRNNPGSPLRWAIPETVPPIACLYSWGENKKVGKGHLSVEVLCIILSSLLCHAVLSPSPVDMLIRLLFIFGQYPLSSWSLITSMILRQKSAENYIGKYAKFNIAMLVRGIEPSEADEKRVGFDSELYLPLPSLAAGLPWL